MHNFHDLKARSRLDLLTVFSKEEAWDCVTPDMHVCQDDLTSQSLYMFFSFFNQHMYNTRKGQQRKSL